MFRISASDGNFQCEYADKVAEKMFPSSSEDLNKLSKLLVRVEQVLGGATHVTLMLPSMDMHMVDNSLNKTVIDCEKCEETHTLKWSVKGLNEEEKVAATAYLSVLAHAIQQRLQPAEIV